MEWSYNVVHALVQQATVFSSMCLEERTRTSLKVGLIVTLYFVSCRPITVQMRIPMCKLCVSRLCARGTQNRTLVQCAFIDYLSERCHCYEKMTTFSSVLISNICNPRLFLPFLWCS